jgi:hypothetical protein
MAGNTKLIGFATESKVVLQRWGKKVTVQLTPSSVDALLEACRNELPKNPVGQASSLLDFRAEYHESTGTIELRLSSGVAKKISAALHDASVSRLSPPEDPDEMEGWSARLKELVTEHEEYLNTKDEPGVE